MKTKIFNMSLFFFMSTTIFGGFTRAASAQTFDLAKEGVAIRIADLTIDPAQLEKYTAAVKEEIDDAVRLEPGVLAIYAVAMKGKSNQIRFVEIYTSED
ncbi:MAG: antibiotic biosynthesis monooxygenase, partial [Proteobacteria bacterium]